MKENNKIKYFLECALPISSCNFRCEYCYVTQNPCRKQEQVNLNNVSANVEKYLTKERLGGACMVNICSPGETLLNYNSVNIVKAFLKNGHYVMVVTNGTLSNKFDECCAFPKEYRERLFFKFSFHYLELKNKGLLETFFNNIKNVHAAGISFTVEITPDDSYIPYIEDIKQVCMNYLGVLCHVTVVRDARKENLPLMTKLTREEFINIWKDFDSTLFDFKESIFEIKRKEYCYAGKWSFIIHLDTGAYYQCYEALPLGNVYEDEDAPLNASAVGKCCPEGHCYNGHAFLGFGLIPQIKTPFYLEMRDRVNNKGEHWIKPIMAEAMSSKLFNRNKKDSLFTKIKNNNTFKKVKIKLGLIFKKKK